MPLWSKLKSMWHREARDTDAAGIAEAERLADERDTIRGSAGGANAYSGMHQQQPDEQGEHRAGS
jgi:hypothetical protein